MKATTKEDIKSHLKKELYSSINEVVEVVTTRHAPVYICENRKGLRFPVHVDKLLINK